MIDAYGIYFPTSDTWLQARISTSGKRQTLLAENPDLAEQWLLYAKLIGFVKDREAIVAFVPDCVRTKIIVKA